MDISKLKHDAANVQTAFVEADEQLIAKKDCYIIFPAGYVNKGLATIGNEISVLAVFAYVVGDKYAVSLTTSMVLLSPSSVEQVTINEDDYYQLFFTAGSVVIKNVMLVKNKKLTNYVMDYYFDYATIPWFIDYGMHAEILNDTASSNDVRLAPDITPFDIITAHISRNPSDYKMQYRHVMKTNDDIKKQPLVIPLRDIANNTTSNLARINGSELNRALKAALTSEPTRIEPLEEIYIK